MANHNTEISDTIYEVQVKLDQADSVFKMLKSAYFTFKLKPDDTRAYIFARDHGIISNMIDIAFDRVFESIKALEKLQDSDLLCTKREQTQIKSVLGD